MKDQKQVEIVDNDQVGDWAEKMEGRMVVEVAGVVVEAAVEEAVVAQVLLWDGSTENTMAA